MYLRYALAFLSLLVIGFLADLLASIVLSRQMGPDDAVTIIVCAIAGVVFMRSVLNK
jgi:hypothetical protein